MLKMNFNNGIFILKLISCNLITQILIFKSPHGGHESHSIFKSPYQGHGSLSFPTYQINI